MQLRTSIEVAIESESMKLSWLGIVKQSENEQMANSK
jgi:hypothetical protein